MQPASQLPIREVQAGARGLLGRGSQAARRSRWIV